MTYNENDTRWKIIQRVAAKLNGDRGKMSTAYTKVGRGKKAVMQFSPCEKADVYLAAIYPRRGGGRPDPYAYVATSEETQLADVRRIAAATACSCHSGWTEADLLAVEEGREPTPAPVTGKPARRPVKGDASKVDGHMAMRALNMANGDRQAAYSRVVQMTALKPPFDNRDLQAWYEENL